jgi:hypothetical protein
VDVEVGGDLAVDLVQEGDEVGAGVAGSDVGDHLAGGDLQGGEQIAAAVALVVMGRPLRCRQQHRQDRRGAVERLDLRLLIHREHRRGHRQTRRPRGGGVRGDSSLPSGAGAPSPGRRSRDGLARPGAYDAHAVAAGACPDHRGLDWRRRRGARPELRGAANERCGGPGDYPRPHMCAVPRALRRAHPALPRLHRRCPAPRRARAHGVGHGRRGGRRPLRRRRGPHPRRAQRRLSATRRGPRAGTTCRRRRVVRARARHDRAPHGPGVACAGVRHCRRDLGRT